MESIHDVLNIPSISSGTNFWMIRTKRGLLFNEFISKKYIAIGWNLITKSSLRSSFDGDLRAQIQEVYGERVPGSALNKCVRFCYEMKPGDIVVIVDGGRAAFAIVGDYYEEQDSRLTVGLEKEFTAAVEHGGGYHEALVCPYAKRRHITPIRVLREKEFISSYLRTTMSNNLHSLSRLNDYSELILSACYDAYTYQDSLFVTFRVTQEDGISAIDLSNLILQAATLLSSGQPEMVTVKTSLHSPGNIVLQLPDFLQENWPLLMCLVVICGGQIKDFKSNPIIDVVKDIVKKVLNPGYEKRKQELELRKLEAETKIAEQEAIAKELDNLERSHKLAEQLAEDCIQPLAVSAERLQLQPTDTTVENIQKALEVLRAN